jgi:hypothetical protein
LVFKPASSQCLAAAHILVVVHIQGQDSRIFFKSNPNGQSPFINGTDQRLAYTDLGTPKGPISLRVGGQELAYGDERLGGASNWGNSPAPSMQPS